VAAAYQGQGSAMNRRAEFCRKQAQRLFSLAEQCVDPQIRDQVIAIAREWERQANAKEGNTHAVLVVKEDAMSSNLKEKCVEI
jgi:hypothetical protein